MLTDAHRSVVLSPMDVVGRLEFDTLLEVDQRRCEIFSLERFSSLSFLFGGHRRVLTGSATPSLSLEYEAMANSYVQYGLDLNFGDKLRSVRIFDCVAQCVRNPECRCKLHVNARSLYTHGFLHVTY